MKRFLRLPYKNLLDLIILIMKIRINILIIIVLTLVFSACHKNKIGNNKKYNVLFIAVDDLRPELGCYGKEYMHTPNIDKLASEGRIFTNHFVHSAVCGPSRNTLLSGQRTLNWDYWKKWRESGSKPDSIISLPQLFRENGYMTVCIGKVSHQPGGVIDSLQEIHEVPYSWNKSYAPVGEWRDPWRAFFSYTGGKAKEYGYGRGNDTYKHYPFEAANVSDKGYPDGLNAEEAIKQLNELKDTSFFLAVGFYKPHMPFNAPQKYWDLYNPYEIPEANYKQIPENGSNIFLYGPNDLNSEPRRYRWPNDTSRYQITEDRERILKHGYVACVSYIDAQIGKVLDELKRLGLDKNTIVILWGDHGWHLGDYGIWGKHTNFDVALRSPLIIKLPGMNEPGKYTDNIVETVDIFPTLADICDLPFPEHLKGNGVSIKPIVNDSDIKIKKYSWGERNFGGIHGITIRNDQYRLIIGIDNKGDTIDFLLFDNYENPIPHTNIKDSNSEIVKKFIKELEKY
jgi:iduronate 2-sulfatase